MKNKELQDILANYSADAEVYVGAWFSPQTGKVVLVPLQTNFVNSFERQGIVISTEIITERDILVENSVLDDIITVGEPELEEAVTDPDIAAKIANKDINDNLLTN